MTSGLLTQKPGREPTAGEIKCFTIEQKVAQSGKPWIKVKNSTPEQGGTMYKILSAKPTGRTDNYGNISFNLDIEPATGSGASQGASVSQSQSVGAALPATRGNGGGKEGYWERKEAADIVKQPRIERQHAQEMALRYFGQRGGLKGGEEGRTELRMMIDWFQKDVGHVPSAPEREQQAVDPTPIPDEEPF